MKRFFMLMLALVLCLTLATPALAAGGSGTEADPYLVSSKDELTAALANGGYIKLTDSFTVNESSDVRTAFTVDKQTFIDFAGHTITVQDNAPFTGNSQANYQVFTVTGGNTLTVNDSVGTGGVSLSSTTDRDWTAMSTIFNMHAVGHLVVEGGNFINNGGSDMAFVVQLYGSSTANISGGTIESTYTAVRLFMASNSSTQVIVTGGNLAGGTSAIWAQSPNSVAGQEGVIEVSGGTLTGPEGGNAINVARTTAADVDLDISGGTLEGGIKAEADEVSISGGEVTGKLDMLDTSGNAVSSGSVVTGGTFGDPNVTKFLDSSVGGVVSADGSYYVGATLQDAADAALDQNPDASLTVEQAAAGSSLTVPDTTTVVNASGSDVTVNESTVETGNHTHYDTDSDGLCDASGCDEMVKATQIRNGIEITVARDDQSDSDALSVTFSCDISLFTKRVWLMGPNDFAEELQPGQYTYKSGSTIITLSPAYLATLPSGNYELYAEFNHADGPAVYPAPFTHQQPAVAPPVASSSVPATGDETPILLLACLLILSGSILLKKKRTTV